MFVCPNHGCELLESKVTPGAAGGRWIAATRENCPADARSVLPRGSSPDLSDLREFAADSMSLLMDPRRSATSQARSGAQSSEALSHKGYMLESGLLPWRRLRALATARLAFLRPLLPRLFDRNGDCGNWLLDILSARGNKLDPILHVLALRFVEALPDVSPARFGEGPWPCRNPVAAQLGWPTIHVIRHRRDNKRLVGLFECRCGYSYERTISEEGVVSNPRVGSFGETLLPVLRKAVDEEWTEDRVCRETRMSPNKLCNEAVKLGVKLPRPFRPIPWTQERVVPDAQGVAASAGCGDGKAEGRFWLSDAQWGRIAPLMPTENRGLPRANDRRVVSAVVTKIVSGCNWTDLPEVYGPYITAMHRFRRWSANGLWAQIGTALSAAGGPPAEVLLGRPCARRRRSRLGRAMRNA